MTMTRVAVVGATGETGASIINGLLEAGNFVSLYLPNITLEVIPIAENMD